MQPSLRYSFLPRMTTVWAPRPWATRRVFKKSLDKFKVPAAEQKELFDIVGTTKADIIVRK